MNEWVGLFWTMTVLEFQTEGIVCSKAWGQETALNVLLLEEQGTENQQPQPPRVNTGVSG